MGKSLSEILAGGGTEGTEKIEKFVGKTVQIGGFEYRNGSNGTFVVFDALVDGEEVQIRTGAVAIVSALEAMKENGLLDDDADPVEVQITTYETKAGFNSGFKFAEVA